MRPSSDVPKEGIANDQRITSIDVWRGLAALAVVAVHVPHHAYGGWRENPFFLFDLLADYGYIGVPVFVVISGFCIHRRAALKQARGEAKRSNWRAFWVRRFWRLYPTYIAAILFSLALALVHNRYSGWDRIGTDLATHLAMIHNLTDDFATSLSNGAFWSLGMEEQLYLLYIPLLAILTWNPRRAIGCIFLATLGWRIAYGMGVFPEDFFLGAWMMWPFAYWFHWALGALAVDAWAGNVKLSRWTSSLAVAIGFAMLGFVLHNHFFELLDKTRLAGSAWLTFLLEYRVQIRCIAELAFPISFFCLLNWGLQRERVGAFRGLATNALAAVGRVSYSLYLIHVPVIYTLESWLQFDTTPRDWCLRYVIYFSCCLAVAWLFYYVVERRFVQTPMPRQERSNALKERFASS